MSEKINAESMARTIATIRGYRFEWLPETSWFFGWNESKTKMRKRALEIIELIEKSENSA